MYKLLVLLPAFLLLIACVGEDDCQVNGDCLAADGGIYGTGDGSSNAASPYEGQVLLGPVIGATVTVHKFFDDEQEILCETRTSLVLDLELGGTFTLPASCIANDDSLYVITASGGLDIDVEYDGIIDTTFTPVLDDFHTLVLGKTLYQLEGWKVSNLTQLYYQFALFAKNELKANEAQIIKIMQLFAAQYITQNLEETTGIDYADVLKWHPRFHQAFWDREGSKSPQVFFKGIWDDIKPVATRSLNDTGITTCADYRPGNVWGDLHNNHLDCTAYGVTTEVSGVDLDNDPIPAGQDAVYGRDVTHNDNSDGLAGFSFNKIDENGQVLAHDATQWRCVQDKVTGLMWEVKTTDGGLQHNKHYYSWYNSSGKNDGGEPGVGDTGLGTTTGYESDETLFEGQDNCFDAARCDTEKYAEDVNTLDNDKGLCGYTDWRLPTHSELYSIVSFDRFISAIDSDYFPNEGSSGYIKTWTSSVLHKSSGGTLNRLVSVVHFARGGESDDRPKTSSGLVRLVRATKTEATAGEPQ